MLDRHVECSKLFVCQIFLESFRVLFCLGCLWQRSMYASGGQLRVIKKGGCLGLPFRICLEGDSEFFLREDSDYFSADYFNCSLLLLNREYRIDCSVFIIVIISWSRNNSFIFQFTLCRWLKQCLFECLILLLVFSSVFSVLFECLENWVCGSSLMSVLTVFYVQWFLIESFFGYFWKWQCFNQSSVCKCNCFSESQCYLRSSIVG